MPNSMNSLGEKKRRHHILSSNEVEGKRVSERFFWGSFILRAISALGNI